MWRALEQRLIAAVATAGGSASQWEGSVRGGDGEPIVGGRRMIERATRPVVEAVWGALALPIVGEVHALLDAAGEQPLIAGWDLGGRPCAKLYVNASDADDDTRRALARQVGWVEPDDLPRPPHLLALNASAGGALDRKAYVQRHDVGPSELGVHEASLRAGAHAAGLLGGVVQCWEVEHARPPRPRAFFVGLRHREAGCADELLHALPGWDEHAVTRALGFERGECRSIGVDVRAGARRWTAYFKPRGHDVELWNLEPTVVYVADRFVVSAFLAPSEHCSRAFARTDRTAISFRGEGEAPRALSEPLMRWVVQSVRQAEATNADVRAALACPPSPWRTAEHGGSARAQRGDARRLP
jgi:hypothetical protein